MIDRDFPDGDKNNNKPAEKKLENTVEGLDGIAAEFFNGPKRAPFNREPELHPVKVNTDEARK